MRKLANKLWILGGLLLLSFVAAGAAGKATKVQVVYRGSEVTGEWQLFIFGPTCEKGMKMHVYEPNNPVDPIKLQCIAEK